MRSTFDVVERYTGNGAVSAYDFDFKIEALTQLMVIVLDASNVEVQRVRGTDVVYLSSVTFDDQEGGGTVNLQAVLPNNYKIIILLANDAPTQNYKFRDKFSFTLRDFENALDWVVGAVQRLSWLGTRSIRLNDGDPGTAFDPQLPYPLEADRVIMIDSDGLSLVQGPTIAELSQAAADVITIDAAVQAAEDARDAALAAEVAAEAARDAALVAETNAETAETNAAASAAAAALSAIATTGPFAVTENTNADLTGTDTDELVYDQVDYMGKVKRGTTVFASIAFSKFYRAGGWEIAIKPDVYNASAAETGVTFTIANAATGLINAAVDNSGAGNASITLKEIRYAV